MGSIGAVITLGLGPWGGTGEVLTLGYGSGEVPSNGKLCIGSVIVSPALLARAEVSPALLAKFSVQHALLACVNASPALLADEIVVQPALLGKVSVNECQ
jgi:hypothetical protein